jgi:hypothetical protein
VAVRRPVAREKVDKAQNMPEKAVKRPLCWYFWWRGVKVGVMLACQFAI